MEGKKKKKQKVKGNDSKVGEKDGEVIGEGSENCIVNAAEIMKETKKKKKKRKDDSFVGSKDTHNESNCDGIGLSSKQQENAPRHVEDASTQSTKEDGGERKKKKKHRKKEKYEDGLPADQKEDVDNGTNSLLNAKEAENIEAEYGLSSKQQENAPHHVEDGSTQSTKEDGGERKKKKKHRKKEKYEDGLPADQKEDVDNDTNSLLNVKEAENIKAEYGQSSKQQENAPHHVEDGSTQSTKEDGGERKKKKKHRKKEKYKDGLPADQKEDVDNDTNSLLNAKEAENNKAEYGVSSKQQENAPHHVEDGGGRKKKKEHRKKENYKDGLPADQQEDVDNAKETENNEAEYAKKGKKRKANLVVKGSNDNSPNKSNKKVRFSGQDEVFQLPPKSNTEEGNGEEGKLVKGKPFTLAEDEMVKDAVMRYIEEHDLGDEGLQMVLHCSKHREVRGCWKEIASSIPHRPYESVYNRARVLLMRSESRNWTQEEYDMILEHQELHGNKWKPLAEELGKHPWHVKDTWRRIKLRNANKGHWSQQEYQRLFDLVNTDLQLKLSEEKKSKHGMLKDNISWTAISDELSTRAQSNCCLKWYKQLTSPMVAQGVWADSDDYRLLTALYGLDATCLEDVEWDDLIENRAGDLCRKRWSQMVLHLGHNGNKSFAEQVEVLAQRYCPHLLEAREIWDNKPRVP